MPQLLHGRRLWIRLNRRCSSSVNSSRIVLAAAYAQNDQAEDAARVVTMIRRVFPIFDPHEFGTKFLKSADLDHLRDGMRKAGLYPVTGNPPPDEKMNR
jgi:adenylate cyclase